MRAIGLAMDIDSRTVHGFLRAGSFPEQARRDPRASLLDAHRASLEARIAAGCRNAMQVWRELRARGLTGGRSIVRDVCGWLVARDGPTFSGRQRLQHVVRPPGCWGGSIASSRQSNATIDSDSCRPSAR